MDLKKFYRSKAWQHCRASYLKKVGGLCERCLGEGLYNPAVVVHHRIYLTPDSDAKQLTSFDNLEALCWHHHEEEHKGRQRRYMTDSLGHVVGRDIDEGR